MATASRPVPIPAQRSGRQHGPAWCPEMPSGKSRGSGHLSPASSGSQPSSTDSLPRCIFGFVVPLTQISDSLSILSVVAVALVIALTLLLWRESRRRRRAERSGDELRSQLETVTATMREGVIAYDMERRLRFVNPAFERLTGYPEDELRDQDFLQYIHPDDRPAIMAEWDRLAQGRALRGQEYRGV